MSYKLYTKTKPRAWSEEQEKELLDLKGKGYDNLYLAKHFDRTEVSISIKLKRLGKKQGGYNKNHRDEKYDLNRQFLEMLEVKSVLDVFAAESYYLDKGLEVITNDKDERFETDYSLDYLQFLCLMYYDNKSFDLVDLDPYGSAYDGFDLAIKMARKGIIITLGEVGHQRFKRLDFVSRYYGIDNLNDFTTSNLIEHIKMIGRRNKKELKEHFILERGNIARVYFIISDLKITSQWNEKEELPTLFDFGDD